MLSYQIDTLRIAWRQAVQQVCNGATAASRTAQWLTKANRSEAA